MKRSTLAAILLLVLVVPAAVAAADVERMMEIITRLSSPELKGRGTGTPESALAAAFIAEEFEAAGLLPGGDTAGSWYEDWTDSETGMTLRNVVGVLPGRNPAFSGQSMVIGAHYDHLGVGAAGENSGTVYPGADDNASGVAVLVETARAVMLTSEPERTIVFAAFTGEETGRKGSRWYVRNHRQHPASKCSAMVNLDTVGRLGKNKLIVLGGGSAREWPDLFNEIEKTTRVEVVLSIQDLDTSDQKSFHEAGVPAVQLFSGPHEDYHRPTDSVKKIDVRGLEKVALLSRALVMYLANLPGPLTSTVTRAAETASAAPPRDRKVSLGIVPDFTYNEQGVRLSGAAAGGPAAAAGLRDGDIIIAADDRKIISLKDLSDLLKTKQPGDTLTVRFQRQGKELKTTVVLKEK